MRVWNGTTLAQLANDGDIGLGGAVAALSDGSQFLVAGRDPLILGNLETDSDGYSLFSFAGSSFSATASSSTRTRVLLTALSEPAVSAPTPRNSTTASGPTRVTAVSVYGAAGRTLLGHAGACQRTSVIEAYEVSGSIGIGKSCMAPADCLSGVCTNSACAP